MAIISENNAAIHSYRSSQFRYAMTYVVVTFVLIIFLNVFSSSYGQQLIYQNKEGALTEKCRLAADEISALQVLNPAAVSATLSQMESLKVTRLIVTDQAGLALYDSAGQAMQSRVLLPEVLQALEGSDVFCGSYSRGRLFCRAATPIFYYSTVVGCVYMTDFDAEQGALLQKTQHQLFRLTLVLELAVVLFAILYTTWFSRRIGKIMNSIRIIQDGDYSHRVEIRGNDEIALLGQEVNDLTERLNTSEEVRHQFVSDASHEIKTPLASIKLLSDSILQNDMDAPTMREFVSDIGDEAERLNRITAKLLTLSKIDSELHQEAEIIHILPTIHRVTRMLSPTAQAASVTIQLDAEQDFPILLSEDDLHQILFNLMENGIKYNVSGGSLTIGLHRQEDNAVITVADAGMGIPEAALKHIFDRFYRVDKARSRASGGSGLGLAIVQSLVHQNRGEIFVESVPGKGTVFSVVFPIFDLEAAL